jgi:hypothetical protein
MLSVEILYTGQWYRETFGYEPDAPNIRHVVQIIPVGSADTPDAAGWLFSSLNFSPSPEPFTVWEGREEYAPLLKYLYDAPQGMAVIELKPGRYNVAAAFIAAPLPPPSGDVTLYPGVTGGGASNEFQVVEIVAGKTVYFSVELTDENGWGYLMETATRLQMIDVTQK